MGVAGHAVGDGKAGKEHHDLGGDRDAGGADGHQHEDPRQPGVAHEVRGFVDERFRYRSEEHRRNDTCGSGRAVAER
jgi:hypothetical protein